MEKPQYYSITVKKMNILTRHSDWLVKTQELYNQILEFYYNLYLDTFQDGRPGSMEALRTLEKLTIPGRDRQPVQYPLPWQKVPLYFRRAAINSAIAAASSYLSREKQKMRDIQGVTKSTDGTIWLCSYGENKVRHIDEKGNELGNFDIKEPSGIANDSKSNTLWTLTNNYLYNCSYDGVVQKSIKIHIKGQDQLFLDEKNDLIYFSAGADYHGDSYIYTVDLKTSKVKPLYVLKDSYAIEGITIVDDVLYVLNDGYYHDAETPINQVNMYFLNKMQTKENYQ